MEAASKKLKPARKRQRTPVGLNAQSRTKQYGHGITLALPELHDRVSGKIDAKLVAQFTHVPLAKLCAGLKLNYKAISKNPASEKAQESLWPVRRILEILIKAFGKREIALAWLNTPHPDLGNKTALAAIEEGKAEGVLTLLENALNGVPS